MTYKEECKEAQRQFEERGHQAKLVLNNEDITVIDWINGDGSSDYYVRYILSRTGHRQNIYLSGDLGDAVFEMFWNRNNLTICEIAKLIPEGNADYLFRKMVASSDKYVFDNKLAQKELEEYLKERYDDDEEGYPEGLDDAISFAMDDFTDNGFGSKAYDIISEYDSDCFEWIGHCGRRVNFRCYLWVVGLIMACRQLVKEEVTK